MKSQRDIIFKPVVSEKSYLLNEEGKYSFFVDKRSNKSEIKNAIEKLFSVKVAKVNTLNKAGKVKRNRLGTGVENSVKKAIVTLREGDIDIFGASAVDDTTQKSTSTNSKKDSNTDKKNKTTDTKGDK
jgi:large subunit ribosomal protein L23